MITPGVAAQEAPQPESSSFYRAMNRDGIMAERGTTGGEPAMSAQQRREGDLVEPDETRENRRNDGLGFVQETQTPSPGSNMA